MKAAIEPYSEPDESRPHFIHFNISHQCIRFQTSILTSRSPIKILYFLVTTLTFATCPIKIIHIYIQIIFGTNYEDY
jgi:hypothetical protein